MGPAPIFRTNPCEFVTDGMHAAIVVYVDPNGAADFDRERGRDPLNAEEVVGLGDAAFSHGLASLHVRAGAGYFVLATQHGAGRDGIADLEGLARAALARTSGDASAASESWQGAARVLWRRPCEPSDSTASGDDRVDRCGAAARPMRLCDVCSDHDPAQRPG
jgi:hypothetical protein